MTKKKMRTVSATPLTPGSLAAARALIGCLPGVGQPSVPPDVAVTVGVAVEEGVALRIHGNVRTGLEDDPICRVGQREVINTQRNWYQMKNGQPPSRGSSLA